MKAQTILMTAVAGLCLASLCQSAQAQFVTTFYPPNAVQAQMPMVVPAYRGFYAVQPTVVQPTVVQRVVVQPTMIQPAPVATTTYYAPAPVAVVQPVPVVAYRRGLFGRRVYFAPAPPVTVYRPPVVYGY